MSGDVKLEPCPHCGSDSCRVIGGPGTRGGPKYWAGCDHCSGRAWGDSQGEAIAAWNRRSSSAAERAVVEARREALEEAAKVVDPTNGPPCDCITLHDDEWWMPHCDCRNGGDSDEAQSWCTSKNEARRIRALSSVRGEGGDKQARPSGSAPISTDTKGTTK